MHIPACQTTQLELISFDQALEEAKEPNPDYDSSRWLYDTSLEPEGIAP